MGKESVLFLPYELLRENPIKFIGDWLRFIGSNKDATMFVEDSESKNVRSISESSWELRNPFISGVKFPGRTYLRRLGLPEGISIRFPDLIRDPKITLRKAISQRILQAYKTSNKKLSSYLSEINLSGFGYF